MGPSCVSSDLARLGGGAARRELLAGLGAGGIAFGIMQGFWRIVVFAD